MNYLPYFGLVDTEITIEKLDKVAKTLREKIKSFTKFFAILVGWFVFNFVIALFFCRTRSLSLDNYRMISEELLSLSAQDILFVLTLIFDIKIDCVITLAMMFSFGVAFFIRVLNLGNDGVVEKRSNRHTKDSQSRLQGEAYVVSYKHQVAFLA